MAAVVAAHMDEQAQGTLKQPSVKPLPSAFKNRQYNPCHYPYRSTG